MHFLAPTLALFYLTAALPSSSSTPPMSPDPKRRGLPYNDPSYVHHFDVPDNKINWAYNWASLSDETHAQFEFVPMLWNGGTGHTSVWPYATQRAAECQIDSPTHLLGFNEPDNCQDGAGGSCMTVPVAVAAWKQWMEPAKALKKLMYLGSPAVTNSGGAMGLTWLSEFLSACDGCNVDFICIHWYDKATNINYFKSHVNAARDIAGGRPIWITEIGPSGTDEEIKNFLRVIIPWLEASAVVHRYAYFMARPGFLINQAGDGMSEIGRAWATL